MREAWKRRVWIVDGHNAIFALPFLSRLQQEGERQQARRQLEEILRPFAAKLDHPVAVVYDGNRLLPNPEACETGHLRTLYSQPPEEADDRIVFLAAEEQRRGRTVAVVSNDRRSLQPRLPRGAVVMSVEGFWERCLQPSAAPAEPALPSGDFDDIAQHFLERRGEIERGARSRARGLEKQAAQQWRERTPQGRALERTPPDEPQQPDLRVHRPRERRPALGSEVRTGAPAGAGSSPQSGTSTGGVPAETAREQQLAEARRRVKRRRGERQQRRRVAQLQRTADARERADRRRRRH